MSPFEAYELFLATRMHFTNPSYDAIKYNFKIKSDINTFYKRQDKYHFAKLAKHKDPKGLLIANFVENDTSWAGDLFSDKSNETYVEWLRKKESLTYMVSKELNSLDDTFINYFKCKNGQHPKLMKMVQQKKISIETLIVSNDILDFFPWWDKKITDTIIWPKLRLKCIKYSKFLQYDKKKMKKIIQELVKRDI